MEAISLFSTTDTITMIVPINETRIVYAASINNDGDQADASVIEYPGGGISHFHWPGTSVAPAANREGNITDPAFFPNVLPPGTRVVIIDNAWSAGETIHLDVLFVRLAIDKANKEEMYI